MLPKRFHDDNEPIVAPKRFCIYKKQGKHRKTSEHGMEQEDFGNVRVGKAPECGKTSEDCRKRRSAEQENIGVWKTLENIGNVRNIRVWNRKTLKHWSVKQEWKFRAEFKIECGYITAPMLSLLHHIWISRCYVEKQILSNKEFSTYFHAFIDLT